MTLLAFAVQSKYDMAGDIYFATQAIFAKKAGANELSEGHIRGVQCRRAPWADKYAGHGVPASVAVDHGWHFECYGCGQTVDSDLEYKKGYSVSGIQGTVHSAVYCSERCRSSKLKWDKKRKAQEDAAIADFQKIVLARFPEASFVEDTTFVGGQHAYVTRVDKSGIWNREQVVISFMLPCLTVGAAQYRMDRSQRYGPPMAYYSCCAGDKEAFERYALSTKPRMHS